MHRRCIICGQEPGDLCVYPRNMTEARRWQNLANLSTFDVDTESLCRHGCVCASHLDVVQESTSDSECLSGAAKESRNKSGLKHQDTPNRLCSVKWSSSGSGPGPRDLLYGHSYPTNIKAIEEMHNQSKQSIGSGRQETSNVNRCKNGCCRFRGACNSRFQGNPYTYTQMGQNSANSAFDGKTEPPVNVKQRVNEYQSPQGAACCTCTCCPIIRNTSTRHSAEGCPSLCCPLLRNNKTRPPEDGSCKECPLLRHFGSQQSIKRAHKKENGNAERLRSCCPAVRKQRSEDLKSTGDDFQSLSSTVNHKASQSWRSNDSSKLTMNQQNRIKKPELKSQCCQACINCRLKDQEVQVSSEALQSQSSTPVKRPKTTTSFSYQTASLSTGFSAGYGTNSSNVVYGAERKFSNAINVLLMNGSSKNDYDDPCCCPAKSLAPPPEICVQESDLTECNERAAFPEIDRPNYRVCQPATSDQNETNVLVLEEGLVDECSPIATENEAKQNRNEVQLNPNQIQSEEGQHDFPATDNYTKVLELQRVRIKELENLLQQHNLLQQTIQHKVAELHCTDKQVPKDETEI
ncbi:uncharacterized protein LOC108049145 [Drosophila rhopaloa]|uniref:Protein FAM76A n=1 Tax=Drosophila rhopaloa TaxID=1041015 RepID=A0ABM5HUT5_DRORH|nr:uncharacterized protein LOC108049145 [Drosophila rhopaloa]